jgi:predicted ATP-grasp superfamily ATP-dependent carboligase
MLPAEYDISFPRSMPTPGAVETLADKARFAAILERLDIPHPRTLVLESSDDLAAVEETRLTNSFLKPCDSQAFGRRYRAKAFRVESREDAEDKVNRVLADGLRLMLQEYVPGPSSNHYFVDGFVDRGGAVKGLFARRRLRMYPPDFGNSSYMRTVPLSEVDEAVASLRELLPELRYRGIFSAEFKLDPRDGCFRIIEVNARPWWFIGFAADCGVDVALMAYHDALDQDVPERTSYPAGKGFVLPMYDKAVAQELIAAGRMSRWKWLGQVVTAHQAIFAWDDPGPTLGEFAGRIKSKVGRIFGRTAR